MDVKLKVGHYVVIGGGIEGGWLRMLRPNLHGARLSLETGVMHAGGHPAPPPTYIGADRLKAVSDPKRETFHSSSDALAGSQGARLEPNLTRTPAQLSLF
jgi:hypothetical protein